MPSRAENGANRLRSCDLSPSSSPLSRTRAGHTPGCPFSSPFFFFLPILHHLSSHFFIHSHHALITIFCSQDRWLLILLIPFCFPCVPPSLDSDPLACSSSSLFFLTSESLHYLHSVVLFYLFTSFLSIKHHRQRSSRCESQPQTRSPRRCFLLAYLFPTSPDIRLYIFFSSSSSISYDGR